MDSLFFMITCLSMLLILRWSVQAEKAAKAEARATLTGKIEKKR